MSNSQQTRQQLYDRIKASTRDAVVLEEMQRLGFWKEGAPTLPEILIKKEAALTQELRELLKQQKLFREKEKVLLELRRSRLEASRKKRAENKILRQQKIAEKKARWQALKEKEIIYLGEGISGGLNEKSVNQESLQTYQLPVLSDAAALARAMEITVGELRFLSFHRTVSKTTHYKRFYLPKKAGGKRLISTPMPRLKKAQYWVLHNILEKVEAKEQAHGFIAKKSIVTNALPHVQAAVVLNLDLKDFFPSISYQRVKGLFKSFGYSEQIATILGLICTEATTDQVELDGQVYYVKSPERFLPQGAPSSPAITNLICRKLDARLAGIAAKSGFTYTRYADDLTFSASGEAAQNLKALMGFIRKIIKSENFTLHPDKIRIQRKGARKEVTGIVVNDKPGVNAKQLDRFRALLYQIERDGLAGKHWNNSPNLLASINGYANFVYMVDRAKGQKLKERVKAISEKYEYKHEIRFKSQAQQAREKERQEQEMPAAAKKKPWWKFW